MRGLYPEVDLPRALAALIRCLKHNRDNCEECGEDVDQ